MWRERSQQQRRVSSLDRGWEEGSWCIKSSFALPPGTWCIGPSPLASKAAAATAVPVGGFHFGCWYVVHYRKNPLIRWIHQLVSSGGLILLSLNYQHKGTKTTVTLLAHMSHHHCWCATLALCHHHHQDEDKWSSQMPQCAPSATWLHKNFTHATFIKEDLLPISPYLKPKSGTMMYLGDKQWQMNFGTKIESHFLERSRI